jgi:hypothetical protein
MNPTFQQLGIERLSIPERVELIGLIWDSIIEADANVTTPRHTCGSWNDAVLRQRPTRRRVSLGRL